MRLRHQAPARSGETPILVSERGLFVRERIFVPLWVTTLEGILGWLWRSLIRVVRLVLRYPIPSAGLVAEISAYRSAGWPAVLGLTAAVVLLLTAWRQWGPRSYARWVAVPVRSWWRFQRLYSRRWRALMAGCGLLEVHDGYEVMPQIARLRCYPLRDELLLTLAPGQIPTDVTASAEALAHGLGAWRATTRPAAPGQIVLLILWADPLGHAVRPSDLGDVDPRDLHGPVDPDSPDGPDGGPRRLRELLTPAAVLARLAAVVVGVTEAGQAWTLALLPGRHLLISGTTGSGKSGLIWAILWRLRDLIGAGWVTVTALDPKYVELRGVATSGLGTVVTDVPSMPAVLEDLVTELNTRCEAMTGRNHVPSPSSPIRIVIVDELATLTALSDNKSKARVEQALGHLLSRGRAAGFVLILTSVEATKEVVRWRGLCANRVCYRTDDDQADLVLGDGAHDNGAMTELIPEEMPGVAYVRTEGRAGITRVRTVHITDEHLDALHPDPTGDPAPDPPASAGARVIDLTTHDQDHRSAS